jgi:uncharacterized membrane protein
MCIKRKAEMFSLGIVLVSFALAVYFYPIMPDQIASHWNIQGNVDGYTDKLWALFLMPSISLLLLLLFLAIPRIDPLKENIAKFRGYFDGFIMLIMLFLLYLFGLTIIWNFGTKFNMIWALVPAFVGLFYYVGILVENAKRNWFIGIRTPWTIMNENVWNRTHKLGGKLFKISALIAVLGMLFEDYALWFVLVPVIAVSAYLVVYSYFEYQKEMMKKPKKKKK